MQSIWEGFLPNSNESIMRGIQAFASGLHHDKISYLLAMESDSHISGSYEAGEVQALNSAFEVCKRFCSFILQSEEFLIGKFEAFMAAK